MNTFLVLAFLFFIGSTLGWVLELFYRRFFSRNNKERKWINPGFCTGPYLPLYGSGLCLLYLIASTEKYYFLKSPLINKLFLFFTMAVFMTLIEYIAGIISVKYFKIKLWDYTEEWGNIQGVICPKFSFFWSVLGAVYYFLVHPRILETLKWLSENLAFSFVIGLFFGVFIIDLSSSAQLAMKLKKFSEEHDVITKYETLKLQLKQRRTERLKKHQFFLPIIIEQSFYDLKIEFKEAFEHRKR